MEENGISREMLYQGMIYAALIFALSLLLCKFSICRTRTKRPLLVPVQPKNMITSETIDRKLPKNYDNIDPYERNVFRRLDDLPSQQLGMLSCIHTYAHAYTYTHTYIYSHIHILIHSYTHTYMYILIYTCLYSYTLDRSGHQDDEIGNRKPKTKLERLPFYYESDYERSITTTRSVETKGFHKC